jgi:iron(III) transport system substrate-binding protein
MKRLLYTSLIILMLLSACTPQNSVTDENSDQPLFVNVYSARHYDLDKTMFEEFTRLTNIQVNVIDGKAEELLERMERERGAVVADVFMTVGAEHLYRALNSNLLEVLTPSSAYDSIDPMFYGDRWVALSKRARVVVYNPEVTNPVISTYQDLTKPELLGSILIRSASNTYNIALIADFINRYGEEATRAWLSGFVKNFARTPTGNDRDQAKSVLAGLGTYGIMNTYYVGLMLNSSDPLEREVGQRIALIFPEDTHLNISWIGRTVGGSNPEAAQKLIDFLLEAPQQTRFSTENGEYPARDDVEINPILNTWPELKPAFMDFEKLGFYVPKAILLMDEVGWQ